MLLYVALKASTVQTIEAERNRWYEIMWQVLFEWCGSKGDSQGHMASAKKIWPGNESSWHFSVINLIMCAVSREQKNIQKWIPHHSNSSLYYTCRNNTSLICRDGLWVDKVRSANNALIAFKTTSPQTFAQLSVTDNQSTPSWDWQDERIIKRCEVLRQALFSNTCDVYQQEPHNDWLPVELFVIP